MNVKLWAASLTLFAPMLTYASQDFSEMCENPTPTQRITLNAISLSADGQTFSSSARCSKIETYFISDPQKYNFPRRLDISRQSISDLTPVGLLTGIYEINLSHNQVTDISPLTSIKSLKIINLSSNPITDISSISDIQNLESLTAYRTNINDLSPLQHNANLRELAFSGDITDPKVIASLKQLRLLYLNRLNLEGTCIFGELKGLTKLSLSDNQLSDISCIRDLDQLESLQVQNNPITSIDAVANLDNLRSIDLNNTPVKSIVPLENLAKLEIVNLESTEVEDTSHLAEKPLIVLSTHGAPLKWCSPKNDVEIKKGVSCLDEHGHEKSWWRKLLRN